MTRLYCLAVSVLLVCLATTTRGQVSSCEPVKIEELGSTTAPSQAGFISESIITGDGTAAEIQVFAMSIVCASIPAQRGMFSYVSVVANYTSSRLAANVVQIGQFELRCDMNGAWSTFLFNSRSTSIPSDANFDTPLRTDCAVCAEASSIAVGGREYDNITHCSMCQGCSGLNQCVLPNIPTIPNCCNYYNGDQCVSECPVGVSTINQTTNECVCNPGLTGMQCVDIDECSAGPNPCFNNGNCVNTLGSFMCVCSSMFTGDLCEVDVDECSAGPNPCFNNGNCVNTPGSFMCVCSSMFTGDLCEVDIDECASGIAQCMNGATCNNTDGGFVCICPLTFTGTQCDVDVDECAMGTQECMNEAICNNTHGGYDCMCTPQFTGTLCETDVDECTTNNICENGAQCVNIVGGFSCNCTLGFEGMTCGDDIDECSAANNPCDNNGVCINNIGSFSCNCTVGFEGTRCEDDIDECNGVLCGTGGQCMNTLGSFTCDCDPGFEGDMCENIDECASTINPCSNGGTCRDTAGGFNCTCVSGFTGTTCGDDIDECTTLDDICLNGAQCINIFGNYECDCLAGFDGDSCSNDIDECQDFTQFCQMGGACTNTFGSFMCTCPPGITGQTCDSDIDECTETANLCQNGSLCLNTLGSFSCNCLSGYTGSLCETDIDECQLNTQPCKNGGTCTNLAGGYSCQCASGWDGENCDVDIDECGMIPNLCQNGGVCMNNPGRYTCQCGLRWGGLNCEDCSIVACTQCTGANAVCQHCEDGFDVSFNSEECVRKLPCSPECLRGECISGQCVCETGYTGNDCSELCTSRIGGCDTCRMTGSTTTCDQCKTGFIKDGNECKTTECSILLCEECQDDVSVCRKCTRGYEMKEARAVCTLIESRPALTSVEIIGIIVGTILFAIALLALIACIISGIYRAKERPKMKKAPKKTVFQKYASNTNPLYLDSKKTVGLAPAHGRVTAEGMMSIEYNAPAACSGYDSRDDHDDFSSLSVVDETAEFQCEQGPEEWDSTGSLSHHEQSLGEPVDINDEL